MKQTILAVLVFFLTLIGYSQDNFSIKSYINEQEVTINGESYLIDSVETTIPTNYPRFDTLLFISEGPGLSDPVICNFKPNTSYSITMACCGSRDIIPTFKLDNDSLMHWDIDKDLDKIQNQIMDKPFISIRTKNPPKDSIYAWHADAACMTEHKVINMEYWQLGVPPKCYYWNNITSILFFKQDNNLPIHEETDLEEFLGIKNIVELAEICFRLFDNARYVLIFDEENNTINLEYE